MSDRTVAELRAELRQAEQREAAAKEARKKEVPVEYRYTISLAKRHSFDKIYDDTIRRYRIERVCLNAEAAKAVGHSDHEISSGGMDHLYNTVTAKIICPCGGGTSYIGPRWPGSNDGADDMAFELIGLFLVENPEGGDITTIVDEFRARRAHP